MKKTKEEVMMTCSLFVALPNYGLVSLVDEAFATEVQRLLDEAMVLTARCRSLLHGAAVALVEQRELELYAAIDDLNLAVDEHANLAEVLETVLIAYERLSFEVQLMMNSLPMAA